MQAANTRLNQLNSHLSVGQCLFKGPIEGMSWDFDPSKSKLNLAEAISLFRLSQYEEQTKIMEIFNSDPEFM